MKGLERKEIFDTNMIYIQNDFSYTLDGVIQSESLVQVFIKRYHKFNFINNFGIYSIFVQMLIYKEEHFLLYKIVRSSQNVHLSNQLNKCS